MNSRIENLVEQLRKIGANVVHHHDGIIFEIGEIRGEAWIGEDARQLFIQAAKWDDELGEAVDVIESHAESEIHMVLDELKKFA